MEKHSISFIILILILGLMIGSVAGSLAEQVFGFAVLNRPIPGGGIRVIDGFYLIENLTLKMTPAALIGLIASFWFLFMKKGKG